MGVLTETWCFCKGVGKSERMKCALFTGKGPAMARIFSPGNANSGGTGFLIHRNLLLTTHVNLPSVAVAESVEIRLQNGVAATLVPHRFFITSSVLDLTIVGLDSIDGDSNPQGQQTHFLKTCSKPDLDLGSIVYLLGYTEKKELKVGEGKVVIATDNLIKLSTDEITWSPGSAGFDVQGNLAFMICDPMKLATSPNARSSSNSTSSSSSSWKKDGPMQFGIPLPVIRDWLNQQWEGSLDELTKPKLPLIRLMSASQKSEHSCASFTKRRIFKSTDADNDATPSSSHMRSKNMTPNGHNPCANATEEETPKSDPHATTHMQGIPTPEIYESPKLTSVPLRKSDSSQIHLLDINFPPRAATATIASQSAKRPQESSNENHVKESPPERPTRLEHQIKDRGPGPVPTSPCADAEVGSSCSENEPASEVMSSASPLEGQEMHTGYSSEGETMYSAETAESRNYTSPREGKFQQVGRSQSCVVSYNRWGTVQNNPMARRVMLEKQRSFIHGKKTMHSQGGATSQRSNDYFSPTVASIMKKRNNSEPPSRPKQSAVHSSSPRWMF